VDDDLLTQQMMQILLGREGHQVEVASNGLEAFDAVKFEKFDIVFMDLMMPIMDGMEASRRIREWETGEWHTFIVALTAAYLPEEGHRLFEAGIDNYISKPFDPAHVERMLRYSAVTRTLAAPNPKITYPEKLSSREILEIQNEVEKRNIDPRVLSLDDAH
jgi:CheY-like chemotaxis protein